MPFNIPTNYNSLSTSLLNACSLYVDKIFSEPSTEEKWLALKGFIVNKQFDDVMRKLALQQLIAVTIALNQWINNTKRPQSIENEAARILTAIILYTCNEIQKSYSSYFLKPNSTLLTKLLEVIGLQEDYSNKPTNSQHEQLFQSLYNFLCKSIYLEKDGHCYPENGYKIPSSIELSTNLIEEMLINLNKYRSELLVDSIGKARSSKPQQSASFASSSHTFLAGSTKSALKKSQVIEDYGSDAKIQ